MNFKELETKIPFKVNSINFVIRDNLNFLDIELPDKDLDSISKKSKIISEILDSGNFDIENYYLNIYSSGTEKEIELKNLNFYLNQYLQVKIKKHVLNKNLWEGELLDLTPDNIILKVNNKGRFQKIEIKKQEIEEIKTTAKLRKEK